MTVRYVMQFLAKIFDLFRSMRCIKEPYVTSSYSNSINKNLHWQIIKVDMWAAILC